MIIGLTGPLCAGIDTFAEILKKEKGFIWFAYSDILREEAKSRNSDLTRKNLQDLGDELRKKFGSGILSKKIAEKIFLALENNYVIGNIRNPEEVKEMKKIFGNEFVLVMIHAPQKVRFRRLLNRRREKDPTTFEEFLKLEERELGIDQPAYCLKHADVFLLADIIIENSGAIVELREKAIKLLAELNIKT